MSSLGTLFETTQIIMGVFAGPLLSCIVLAVGGLRAGPGAILPALFVMFLWGPVGLADAVVPARPAMPSRAERLPAESQKHLAGADAAYDKGDIRTARQLLRSGSEQTPELALALGTVARIKTESAPLVGTVGMAVDYSHANNVKAALQAALDSTALMLAAMKIGAVLSPATMLLSEADLCDRITVLARGLALWMSANLLVLAGLYLLNLEGCPAADSVGKTAKLWVRLLWEKADWHETPDAPRIKQGFASMANDCKRWPAPATFWDHLPKPEPRSAGGPMKPHEGRERQAEALECMYRQFAELGRDRWGTLIKPTAITADPPPRVSNMDQLRSLYGEGTDRKSAACGPN